MRIGPYQYAAISYAFVFQVLYLACARPLHKEYDWAFYRKAGADAVFRHKYRQFLRLHVLLKLGTSSRPHLPHVFFSTSH